MGITDKYLNNFKIYCLILDGKKEQAQLLFDLSKELDEIDTFFENKFNILMGYASKDEIISDENILYFHLSHKTNNDLIMSQKWTHLNISGVICRHQIFLKIQIPLILKIQKIQDY